MLFQIRRGDGSIDPHSSGTLIEPTAPRTHLDGTSLSSRLATVAIPIKRGGLSNELDDRVPRLWVAPKGSRGIQGSGVRTPESTGVTYWEGSVAIEGNPANERIRGRGYLEMTGYAGARMGTLIR